MFSDKITAIKGDMFDPQLNADGYAIFFPCGMTAFRIEAEKFMEQNKNSKKAIIADKNEFNKIYPIIVVQDMVMTALDSLVQDGARRISMNAIRTNMGAGPSERATRDAVERWLNNHPFEDVHVFLVDKRGGFNRLIL